MSLIFSPFPHHLHSFTPFDSLEAHVLRSDESALARDCAGETKQLLTQLSKLDKWKRAERKQIQIELRQLKREERKRSELAISRVLDRAHVVCATLTGVQQRALRDAEFDVCIIDEAAQALEVACWAAVLKARKVVLVGDHLQLPPTVMAPAAAEGGLGVTMFERLHALYGDTIAEMLTTQYRMHASIMQWSSDVLYDGRLIAHASVADHTLYDLGVAVDDAIDAAAAGGGGGGVGNPSSPPPCPSSGHASSSSLSVPPVLVFVDTAGCDMAERQDEAGSSYNEAEAALVMKLVGRLVARGLAPGLIGVIAPYAAQVAALKAQRREGEAWAALEISTVDGFQGREKEAIVISTVRSNTGQGVGFLADKRRMNVAVTRAKRQCVLVGDSETLRRDPFLEGLVAYFESRADYHSADEFADLDL